MSALSPPPRSSRARGVTLIDTRVRPEDLQHLDAIQELLFAFSDSCASATNLARYVEKSPVLCARIAHRFATLNPDRALPRLVEQIAVIGNRELEGVLMQLLEDIVTLHSELAPPRKR